LATLRNRAVEPELETETTTTSWSEVAVLVRRAQAGDRIAFGRLVEQFQRTVHAIGLRRLGNPSEAVELTQEVFLHVMRRIGQLREPERFAGWLRQVTVRMAINRATRRVAPACVETVVLEAACAEHEGPLAELIARERAHRLWEALAELKPLDREALLAFYIQGESLLAISERLDVPIGTVKRRLHTARKRLKAALLARAGDAGEWSEAEVSVELEDDAQDDPAGPADLVAASVGVLEPSAW
jgi:RNA polymerase sigma-70 factor (ECF subfamily)